MRIVVRLPPDLILELRVAYEELGEESFYWAPELARTVLSWEDVLDYVVPANILPMREDGEVVPPTSTLVAPTMNQARTSSSSSGASGRGSRIPRGRGSQSPGTRPAPLPSSQAALFLEDPSSRRGSPAASFRGVTPSPAMRSTRGSGGRAGVQRVTGGDVEMGNAQGVTPGGQRLEVCSFARGRAVRLY